MSKITSKLVVLSLCGALLVGGCSHVRLQVREPNPGDEYESATVHTFFYGLLKQNTISAETCRTNIIDEVVHTTNLAYDLVAVVTLGLWAPQDFKWKCGKRQMTEGNSGQPQQNREPD